MATKGYTKFSKVEADEFKGPVKGDVTGGVTGDLTGGLKGAVQISKAADYALTAAEKGFYIGVTLTAVSKTLTLGLAAKQIAIVVNEGGTNAVTVKNVAGDTGTSLAAGKAILIVGSATANASVVTELN